MPTKLKQKIVYILKKLLVKLDESEDKVESLFEDLTPSNDVDTNGKYSDAIIWGLENKKVKNIALTGPYGSGKSSILSTFQEQHTQNYKFLNISLATFHTGKLENDSKLEKSILQQMIYRVQDETIPFSRFKRIKHIRTLSVILHLVFFGAFIIAGMYLLKPDSLQGIYEKTLIAKTYGNGDWKQLVPAIFIGLFFLAYPLFAFKNIYRFTRANLNFNKVTIANATIEQKAGEGNESIFDKYLDEILYFFEATKYNVVILEDLDRFNNIDIFENLRELNELINNSESVNRRVVFIYAIKDEIFGEEDSGLLSRNRTKFFDFIIPVIPIINASNSGDVIKKKIKSSPYADKINYHFLDDVTIYIDDMRILKNIFNEFIVYQQKLGGIDLDSNKLLAMVIYKNIYPIDFSKLQYKKGMVYEIFQKKQQIIEEQRKLIDARIQELEEKLINVQTEALTTIEELQHVYLSDLGISRLQANSYYIQVDNTNYHYNTANIGQLFERLRNASSIRFYLPHGNRVGTVNDIATVFGKKRNYFEREEAVKIIEENGIEDIKQKLSQSKKEKQELSSQSLKVLIAKSNPKLVFSEEIYEKKLLVYLLRHGYIDEMYDHYITYFYPESLSLSDIQFVFSIKNHEALPFDYELENTEKIMAKLVSIEFKQVEALNYNLLNFIMENCRYSSYYDNIIEQLGNGSDISIKFIHEFKEIAMKKDTFINSICNKWKDMWNYIKCKSNYTDKEKDEYLADILVYADVAAIIQMDINSVMSDTISKHPNFHNLFSDEEKIKEVLLKLHVKFEKLHLLNVSEALYDFIVQHNMFEINKDNLLVIIKDTPYTSYESVKKSGQQSVIDYVDEHINTFVKNVLLDVEIHTEPEESLLELLNNEELDLEIKKQIVTNKAFAITNIGDLINELWPVVIREKKMVASWPNVLLAFIEYDNKIPNFLVHYLNYPNNVRELAKYKLKHLDGFEEETLEIISDEIIKSKKLTDDSFEELSNCLMSWDFYPAEDMSEKRARIMIGNNLLRLTLENFNSLKSNFDNLHILLVERNIEAFISEQETFLVDTSDLKQLLDSSQIHEQYKVMLVEHLNPEILREDDTEVQTNLIHFIVNHKVKITDGLQSSLLQSSVSLHVRIELLTELIEYLDIESITDYLSKLDEPYSEIAERGRRLQFEKNKINKSLVAALENKSYISSSKEDGDIIRVNTRMKMSSVN